MSKSIQDALKYDEITDVFNLNELLKVVVKGVAQGCADRGPGGLMPLISSNLPESW